MKTIKLILECTVHHDQQNEYEVDLSSCETVLDVMLLMNMMEGTYDYLVGSLSDVVTPTSTPEQLEAIPWKGIESPQPTAAQG